MPPRLLKVYGPQLIIYIGHDKSYIEVIHTTVETISALSQKNTGAKTTRM